MPVDRCSGAERGRRGVRGARQHASGSRHAARRARVPVTGRSSFDRIMSRWGDEKTLHFISCYRYHECLWNPTSVFYKKREARAKAYESMLEQFDDENMTVQLIKAKIKNIRTTYHQELNKIKHSRLAGAAPVYKPTLTWFDAMDSFLRNIMNKEPTQITDQQLLQKVENLKRKLDSSTGTSSKTPTVNHIDNSVVIQPPEEQVQAKKQIRVVANKLMSRSDNELAGRLENTPTVSTPGACEDEFHFFGMNVAAQLRRLPLHVALQLQTDFQNTLFLARIGQALPSVADTEDNIMPMNEDVSDGVSVDDSVDHDVDDRKEFSQHVHNAIKRSIESDVPSDHDIKRDWDAC